MASNICRIHLKKISLLHNNLHKAFTFLHPQLIRSLDTGPSQEFDRLPIPTIEKSVNEVMLLGRLKTNPISRGTEENPVTLFHLATKVEFETEKGKLKQRTDIHNVCVFKPGLREKVLTHVKKGQRCFVQGKLVYGEVTDYKGQEKPIANIIADDVIYVAKDTVDVRQNSLFAE